MLVKQFPHLLKCSVCISISTNAISISPKLKSSSLYTHNYDCNVIIYNIVHSSIGMLINLIVCT